MAKQYRQGDVLIERARSLPKERTKAERAVLALGEATGHCHQIETGAFMFLDVDGEKWLDVFDETATVVHEEHGPITLPRGRYRVIQQREYEAPGINRSVLD